METPSSITPNSNKQPLLGLVSLSKKSWEIFVAHPVLFLGIFAPAFIISVFSNYFPLNFWRGLFVGGVWIWATLALLYAIKERDQGISVIQALKKGTGGFLPFVWLTILALFISGGGFLLFIVPGILLGIWFFFAQYVFVDGKEKGMNALLRSKDLVSGYTWQVFLRLFVLVLVSVIVFISSTLFLEMLDIGRPLFPSDPEIVAQPFFVGDTIIDSLGLIPSIFFTIFGFVLYENIKQVKGNPAFEIPSRKRKLKYLAVGFAGLFMPIFALLALLLIVLVWSLLKSGLAAF